MAGVPDLYGVLGVHQGASEDDIKRAYRRLARELHPDVNGDPEAERRFKQVSAAYETLSDPARRRQYDLFGSQGVQGGQGASPFGDFGDLFDVFFGGGFGGAGGRRGTTRRRTRARQGEDAFVQLGMTFEEAAFGIERSLALQLLAMCERCGGTGAEPGTHPSRCRRCGGAGELQDVARSVFGTVMTKRPCPQCQGSGEEIAAPCAACHGEGRAEQPRDISVQVPAGVADGMDLRLAGQGHQGRAGGPPGDLYVSLRVEPHPVFERDGQDLVCALHVPMTQAALGAEVAIPTLEGPTQVRLEAGVASGTVLRLRSHGLPNLGRRGRGDLLVTVVVETPSPKSKEERALLERLAEVRGEHTGRGDGFVGKLRKLLNQ